MATQKQIRFLYQSRNNVTSLIDVKAQVYVNGVAKAVGASALTASEVDASHSPGVYEVVLSAANLTTWGVAAGTYAAIEVVVDSASKPAETIFRTEATVANVDDIDTKLGAPAGASVSADIAAVKTDTAAIKVDLESGPNSLATILAAITAIQNNAGFAIPVPAQLTVPSSGSNAYRIPVTIYNEHNQLIDPDSNSIVVALVNQAGTDRGSLLTGSSGSPATVAATRDSVGQYHVDLALPAGAAQEELIFTFSYAIGGVGTARKATTRTINDISSAGYALQSTLIAVQTTVNSIQSEVTDATNGLPAIKTAIVGVQSELTNNIEGAGFSNTTDSLHALSQYLQTYVYFGGKAF